MCLLGNARTVWIQIRLQVLSKIVSMIRKYHNHKPKTNPWHREEEPHNHHKTPGRQTKQSNQLSLPHQDDCETTRMDIKPCLKAPEQSDTKIDSSPQVSNSLIQIGLTLASFFILRGKHIAKYDIHIMEYLPGVLRNRGNGIYSRGTGNKGQILSGTEYKGNIG